MIRRGFVVVAVVFAGLAAVRSARPDFRTSLQAGFAERDITPKIEGPPVYLAGFGHNRKATAVLDSIAVRAVVLRSGDSTIAIACADVVGLFLPTVERIRKRLEGFDSVLVSAAHNHHGPDTMGLWGPNAFVSGVNDAYLRHVEEQVVDAIRAAQEALRPVTARIGVVQAPDLLNDTRLPIVKHDELVALQFRDAAAGRNAGLMVQWHCHPETLDSRNTRISADFVGATTAALRAKYGCGCVYLSGAVGGMMTTIRLDVRDAAGQRLPEGSAEKMRRYAELLGAKIESALSAAKPVKLEPFAFRSQSLALPVDNPAYLLAHRVGVLKRNMERWTGDARQPVTAATAADRAAVRTELGWLRLGELDIAAIPGEIYPELVVGGVVDPPDAGADFPQAPIEPAIHATLRGPYRMIVGLANDELGYIIPKRQWDEKPPFAYGRSTAQYGEINSLGPDTAPILCEEFWKLTRGR